MVSAGTGQCPSHTRMNGRAAPARGGETRGAGCLLALSLQRAAGLAAAASETETNHGHPCYGRSPRAKQERGPGGVAPKSVQVPVRLTGHGTAPPRAPPCRRRVGGRREGLTSSMAALLVGRGAAPRNVPPTQAPGEAPCTPGLCVPTPTTRNPRSQTVSRTQTFTGSKKIMRCISRALGTLQKQPGISIFLLQNTDIHQHELNKDYR